MERAIGEIFFDGNAKLVVQRAANSISCKGCYYNVCALHKVIECDKPDDLNLDCTRATHSCITCLYGKEGNVERYECRRSLNSAGICLGSFRDDGESVVFVEVCE